MYSGTDNDSGHCSVLMLGGSELPPLPSHPSIMSCQHPYCRFTHTEAHFAHTLTCAWPGSLCAICIWEGEIPPHHSTPPLPGDQCGMAAGCPLAKRQTDATCVFYSLPPSLPPICGDGVGTSVSGWRSVGGTWAPSMPACLPGRKGEEVSLCFSPLPAHLVPTR